MIIIFLTLLFYLYLKLSFLTFLQVSLLLFIFFITSIDSLKSEFYIIRICSFFMLLIILFINQDDLMFVNSFLLPLSKEKISFDYNFPSKITYGEFENKEFKLNENINFNLFLEKDKNYIGYFTVSIQEDLLFLTITDFFLFNVYSNSNIIETYLEENIINQENSMKRYFNKNYNRNKVKIIFYYSKFELE